MPDSLWPHGLQHARPPCPSPTPGVHSDSCPITSPPANQKNVHELIMSCSLNTVRLLTTHSRAGPTVLRAWGHCGLLCLAKLFLSQFSSVQSLSRVRLFVTPSTVTHQSFLSITNSQSLLKLMSITLVMLSNHIILCWSLLLPPSIFPSIRGFSNESVLHIRCPKYWSFSLSISPSNESSGLISFRMDWLDLLAVQGTLKSLFQRALKKNGLLFKDVDQQS